MIIRILKELAYEKADLRKLFKKYEKDGYFDESNYDFFLQKKEEYLPREEEINVLQYLKSDKASSSITPEQKIIRIPCPHCYTLCPSHVRVCKKCGEPLSKMKL